jgi:ATP-dependent DNA ligase
MGEGIEGKLGDRVHSGVQTSFVTNTRKGIINTTCPTWRIFDYVTTIDYEAGKCEVPYIERWNWLIENIPTSALAYNMEALNLEHEQMFFDKVVAEGYEGIVSVYYGQEWEATKSRRWEATKWKDRPTADLLCIGWTEGTGKYTGMIGSLELVSKSGIVVNVGSGLDDAKRDLEPHHFVGKVIEIGYEQIMKDGTYQQPTFKRIRDDKSPDDID